MNESPSLSEDSIEPNEPADVVSTPRRRRRRHRSKKNTRKIQITILIASLIALGVGIGWIYWVFVGNQKPMQNLAIESILTSEAFDPVKDFQAILDNGTLSQLKSLMSSLLSTDLSNQSFPARMDNYQRRVRVADRILAHPRRTESDRSEAARLKLAAFWNSYVANLDEGLNDPFVVEQFFSAAESYLDDPDRVVSRDAYLAKAQALVSERLMNRFLGDAASARKSMLDLLTQFPDDPMVLDNMRNLFIRIRAANMPEALSLVDELGAIADRSTSPATQKFSRFLKDVVVLYDSGIGNFEMIGSIMVDDAVFMQKLFELNDNLESGEAVVTQLDNGIEFLERQRKHDLALLLSERVRDNASKRTDPEVAEQAAWVGQYGVQRNGLLGKKWSFEGKDHEYQDILVDRFNGRVVLIVFFDGQSPATPAFRQHLASVRERFFGKQVDFIVVDVDPDANLSGSEPIWLRITTSSKNPHSYLAQCPTRRFPYAVLIDKEGNVDSVNVAFSYLPTRIDYLLSIK